MLGYYERGATPFYACRMDPRFSYCLYVPEDYDDHSSRQYRLIIAVHGTNRPASEYRSVFAEFAADHDCIVLAPLFPVGVTGPGELHDYKFIERDGVRFDQVLLAMVAEVAERYRIHDRLLLHGFSGGGHFAHRFLILHPERLLAVSIGAPGMVTRLNRTLPWWTGVRDVPERFGRPVDIAAMTRVAVQMVVGADDTDTWEITLTPADARWVIGANDAGATRIDRIIALRNDFEANGIEVRLDFVPDTRHDGWKLIPAVTDFFAEVLSSASTHSGRADSALPHEGE